MTTTRYVFVAIDHAVLTLTIVQDSSVDNENTKKLEKGKKTVSKPKV